MFFDFDQGIPPRSLGEWPGVGAFVAYTVTVAIIFTILRWGLTRFVFYPISYRSFPAQLTEEKRNRYCAKMSESLFKGLFYLFAWTATVSVAVWNEYFWTTRACWLDPFTNQVVPNILISRGEFFVYILELGWYLHCSYAHLYEDSRKSDFWLLIIHHIATLLLMYGSMIYGYHRIGMLVLISMDLCDVTLEGAKTCQYIHEGCGWPLSDIQQWCIYSPLPVCWISLRIIYFGAVVINSAYFESKATCDIPDHLFFNVLLMILFALNVYWFILIVRTALRKIKGDRLADIREKSD